MSGSFAVYRDRLLSRHENATTNALSTIGDVVFLGGDRLCCSDETSAAGSSRRNGRSRHRGGRASVPTRDGASGGYRGFAASDVGAAGRRTAHLWAPPIKAKTSSGGKNYLSR